jgi:phosphatidate cytidylyltransferase
MLKYRLLFGTLMAVLFTGLVLLDGWWDGSVTASAADDRPVQGTLLAILAAGVLVLATIELSRLAAARDLVVLNPVSTAGVVLLSTAWYWPQLTNIPRELSLPLAAVVALAAIVLQQHVRFGVAGALGNCGISCFAVLYLGLLGAFLLAVRIDAGLWPELMFIFSVKASDIGAYTFGRMFGKHKFSPHVSPGKTWVGLGGAVAAALLVSFAFASVFGIMAPGPALVFGACMAVAGQLSDLAESMLKRDARQKDSSNRVPGFGGILDVVDSLLFAAPFAYVFFRLVA